MKYIIDTNILLDYPQIVENIEDKLIITTSVLRELDGLKKNVNSDVAFNARRAAIYISRNMDNIEFNSISEKWDMSVDDQLIELSLKLKATILTNDIYLKVRAIIAGAATEGYSYKNDYNGVRYLECNSEIEDDNEMIAKIYETGEIPEKVRNLSENEYLIVKDISRPIINKNEEKDYEIMGIFVYRDGKLKGVKDRIIKNIWIDKIVAKNPEQACLFDALHNRDISIIYAGGGFGRG